eukprot:355328-Chlamydomonas_euryale.AAC.4
MPHLCQKRVYLVVSALEPLPVHHRVHRAREALQRQHPLLPVVGLHQTPLGREGVSAVLRTVQSVLRAVGLKPRRQRCLGVRLDRCLVQAVLLLALPLLLRNLLGSHDALAEADAAAENHLALLLLCLRQQLLEQRSLRVQPTHASKRARPLGKCKVRLWAA